MLQPSSGLVCRSGGYVAAVAALSPPIVWAGVPLWRLCCGRRRPVATLSPPVWNCLPVWRLCCRRRRPVASSSLQRLRAT
eukprot:3085034-Pyramimonas_sp.AAC.1